MERLTEFSEELVHSVVEIVAAGNYDVIHAKLDNFKIKDGDVTVTSKGRASDGALLALNSVGVKALKIIVADDAQFDQHREQVRIDPDEPGMFEDDGSADGEFEADDDGDVLDPETGELTSAGEDTTQAVIDVVEGDLSNEEIQEQRQERVNAAHEFGRGSFDKDGDPDKNPYFEDRDDDLRSAWFNGFYERKYEVEASDSESASDTENKSQSAENDTDQGESITDSAENEPDTSPDAYQAGMQHRSGDGARDENPFDGGTEEGLEWQKGYDAADQEIAKLFNAGYEAAESGKMPEDSGWKDGSDEQKRWMFGFDRWHQQNTSNRHLVNLRKIAN